MTSPLTGANGQQLIASMRDFSNMCLAGRVPVNVRPVLHGTSLCALANKGGCVRPMAMGLTLRRLVAKVACRTVREEVVAKLTPSHLGFGIQHGSEAVAHAARCHLTNMSSGQALLKIDFANAFSTLSRDAMLTVVCRELLGLYPYVPSCYFSKSFLRFGQYTLISDEGPQLGDPFGPLLFCLSDLTRTKRIKFECNIWYMDDGTLGGDVDTLLTDWIMLTVRGMELGLVINNDKCEIITDDDDVVRNFSANAPDIKHVDPASAMLLMVPIGCDQSVNKALDMKLHELQRMASRLSLLYAHDALFLLKDDVHSAKHTMLQESAVV